jgi:hypothetical protein
MARSGNAVILENAVPSRLVFSMFVASALPCVFSINWLIFGDSHPEDSVHHLSQISYTSAIAHTI